MLPADFVTLGVSVLTVSVHTYTFEAHAQCPQLATLIQVYSRVNGDLLTDQLHVDFLTVLGSYQICISKPWPCLPPLLHAGSSN